MRTVKMVVRTHGQPDVQLEVTTEDLDQSVQLAKVTFNAALQLNLVAGWDQFDTREMHSVLDELVGHQVGNSCVMHVTDGLELVFSHN